MAFSIKNPETDLLLRELVALTGENLTTAVTESVRQRLSRERLLGGPNKAERIRAVLDRAKGLKGVDTPASLPTFDDDGLPF